MIGCWLAAGCCWLFLLALLPASLNQCPWVFAASWLLGLCKTNAFISSALLDLDGHYVPLLYCAYLFHFF